MTRARRMSRPAKAGATDEVRPAPPTPLWRCLSSTPKAGGFTAAAASADRAMRAGRVPRMPRWLRQPRHGSRAWYCPFTLASGSDPRHESRVALLGIHALDGRGGGWLHDQPRFRGGAARSVELAIERPDVIRVVGGPKTLVSGTEAERVFVLDQFRASRYLHGSTRALLIAHSDCAAHGGLAARFECDTRVGPFRLTDRMVVTEWRPRRAIGIAHHGIVGGQGRFTLRGAGM